MTPVPANLAHAAREQSPADVYWVVRNGLKMTGMPAWDFRLSDADLCAVVAFVMEIPKLSAADYGARAATIPQPLPSAEDPAAPDPGRGRRALRQYAFATCHAIPGIVDVNAPVGPPLERIGTRERIAGMLPNTPDDMVRWLRFPQQVNPLTAMPDLGVSERDARDMAAYLSTLR